MRQNQIQSDPMGCSSSKPLDVATCLRRFDAVPPSRAREGREGAVAKVVGRVAMGRLKRALVSPITGQECVFYEVEVSTLQAIDGDADQCAWVPLARERAAVDFYLTDDAIEGGVWIYSAADGVSAIARGRACGVEQLPLRDQFNVERFLKRRGVDTAGFLTRVVPEERAMVRERVFRLGEPVAAGAGRFNVTST